MKRLDLDFLKQNVPIQFYAEVELGINEWRQIGGGRLTPNLHVRPRPDANDYSSLVIDPIANCFWRNSNKGPNPHGSIIDFIINVNDLAENDTHTAIEMLGEFVEKYLPNLSEAGGFDAVKPDYKFSKEKVKEMMALTQDVSPDFRLPDKYKNFKRLYAYMIGKRQIEKSVYDYFVKSGFLYQDWRCSACFVSYDDNGVPVFACIRDTDWNQRITYGVRGSSVNHAFYINNHKKKLVVTEAVVDAMAFMSILSLKGERYKKYNYLALTGTKKIQAIRYHLELDPSIDEIYLGFDNDEAGETADKKTREMLEEMGWKGKVVTFKPPYGKDFNDSLIYMKEHPETLKS